MKIISDYTRDTASKKKNRGSYEWWYFDGISKDREYSFVIIFYEGNPFSRRYIQALSSGNNYKYQNAKEYPALSISIYSKGKPVYYGFCEYEAENAFFDSEKIKGKAGNSEFSCSIRNEKLIYEIGLDQKLPSGDSVKGRLKFTSDIGDNLLNSKWLDNHTSSHIWNLVQPQSDVEGEFIIGGYLPRTIRFTGQGYHDHNLGLEPMDNSFLEWYWGRFHFEDSTFVYYIMKKKSGDQFQAWHLGKNGSCVTIDNTFDLEYKSLNLFGLYSSRKIVIVGNGTNCLVQQDQLMDNGPFYQRFSSSIVMKSAGGVKQTRGITEYIHPGRINNRIFWPLVNMRIVYPGKKSHWVQQSPRLYRWTW